MSIPTASKRAQRFSIAVALATLLSAAGCSDVEQRESFMAGPATKLGTECDIAKVDVVGGAKESAPTFTGVHLVSVSKSKVVGDEALREALISPAIAWETDGRITDQKVMSQIPSGEFGDVMTGPSPGLAEVDQSLYGVSMQSGTAYLGYASVHKLALSLLAHCQDGREFSGILHTWTDGEVGVVQCGLPQESNPLRAGRVQDEFCDRASPA